MIEAVKKESNVGDVSVHTVKVRCTQIGRLERKEHCGGHLAHHDEDVHMKRENGAVLAKGRRRGVTRQTEESTSNQHAERRTIIPGGGAA
jgi:hypothetical protein